MLTSLSSRKLISISTAAPIEKLPADTLGSVKGPSRFACSAWTNNCWFVLTPTGINTDILTSLSRQKHISVSSTATIAKHPAGPIVKSPSSLYRCIACSYDSRLLFTPSWSLSSRETESDGCAWTKIFQYISTELYYIQQMLYT